MSEAKKQFINLWISGFIYFFGFGIYWPFFSLYLSSIGFNYLEIGFIGTLTITMQTFLQAFWGYLSDRFKKTKVFMVIGTVLMSFSPLFVILGKDMLTILVVSIIIILGNSAYLPTSMSAVMLLKESDNLGSGKLFGRYRICGSLGWATACIFGGVLGFYYGFSLLFYISGVFFILDFVYTYLFVKDYGHPSPDSEDYVGKVNVKDVIDRNVLLFLTIITISTMALTMSGQYLSLRLNEINANFILIGVTIALGAYSEVPGMLILGPLSDKFGRKKLLILSFIAQAITYTGYSMITDPWFIPFLQPLQALTFGSFYVASVAFVSDIFPKELKSTGMGLYNSAISIGQAVAPLIGGIIADQFSLTATYFTATLMAIASSLLIIGVHEKIKK
ncbi:MAG: MFS transporter [Candidatus Asgardarchaeia archaeon]